MKIGKKIWSLNAVDSRTKYNLCCRLVWGRTTEEIDALFKELKKRVGGQIHGVFEREHHKPPNKRKLVTFVTDKLWQYRGAFNRRFCWVAKLVHGVPISCRRYGLKHNNNPIERHNEDIKQRYRTMRHFKSFESAQAFLELRRAIFNFVRRHQGLKRTPAGAAEIDLGLGQNRLLDLIRICSTR